MASISGLSSSSSSSSIYGSNSYNIISGLASGLDTESMIEGLVQSYQQKIQSLQQDNTRLQWKQEAYQSVSDKLVEFYRNYSSFVYSNTNLASSSFFSKAVTTTANGTYANLVSASGKTSSTVVLNAVSQLATAARYTVSGNDLAGISNNTATGDKMSASLTDPVELSKLSGSLTLNYGDRTVSIDLGERDLFVKDGKFDAAGLQEAITKQLSEQQISTSSGSVVDADTLIAVSVAENGTVSFSDKSGAGNSVTVASASGKLKDAISGLDGKSSGFKIDSTDPSDLVDSTTTMVDYLADKTITVTLDGKSKTIALPTKQELEDAKTDLGEGSSINDQFIHALQKKLDTVFGTTTAADGSAQSRVSVNFTATGDALTFTNANQGSTLSITATNEDVGEVLGIGSGLTNYLDTTKTLGDLTISGINWDNEKDNANAKLLEGVGKANPQKDENGKITGYVDDAGNVVNEQNQRLGEDGELLYGYELKINDVLIGTYTRDTEFNTIINQINSNTEAGVNVSYSKTTGQFVFTAKDTGAGGRIEIEDGLGAALFGKVDPSKTDPTDGSGASYTAGVDAKFIATINGQAMELTRSSNSFDLDGMQVTVSGTFNKDAYVEGNSVMIGKDGDKKEVTDSVTFTSKTDADTIVETVKKMVEDLNAIIEEVKGAYSDMPLQMSNGSKYEPLTDEDMADMSESAIEKYEEKAKTGILFMDSDLSSLYNDLRNAITSSGSDGVTLRSMGIETAYSSGLTTITFDEQKFREALESDPDKVQEAFTKSKENGAATDGLMATLTAITEKYASTDGDVKGILIEKAGSKYSPTAALDNDILDQMKDIEDEISKWEDKMSNQVDYYTNKFTQLELLINQMNSQSSSLASMMGGY